MFLLNRLILYLDTLVQNKAPIDRLGGKRWISRKAKGEIHNGLCFATHKNYVERNTFKSYKHLPDTKWQLEFGKQLSIERLQTKSLR